MNRFRTAYAALFFASFAASVPAQPSVPADSSPVATAAAAAAPVKTGVPLTLEECVARALDRNFDLQIQRMTTSQAKDNVVIAQSDFDPALEVTGSTGTSQQPSAVSSIDGVTSAGLRQKGQDLRAGVSQKITTGGTVSASTSLDRSESNSRNLFLNPAYNGDFSLSVRQPLLRGAGSEFNKSAIRRAELGVDRANYDLKGSVLGVVRAVEGAYYNLAYAREQRTVRNLSLQLAQQLLDENRTRRQTGVATDLDVLQAEVGVANARRNVLLAEQAVSDREDALLQLIGQFEFNQTLGEVTLSDAPVGAVSFDVSYKLARDNQPALASAAASIRQLEIDAQNAKRNKLPTLDVGAAMGLNSREAKLGDAARETWSGDGYSWQVDFALRMPWGLREEKARYRQAVTSVTREQARLQQLDQDLVVDVRAAVRAVDTNRESFNISALATELSQRQYELERARFNAGLSTSRRVLEAQDDLENARVSQLQAQVNLRTALSELQRLEGSSLPRYKITLEATP
ncbi:MAG: TolC family protein [Opitutaceae bacterium]|nr:TolC family protein [Opitutaceae bacterium]